MTRATILCVDDESIVLSGLRGELRRHFGDEAEIETAEGGDEALEVVDEILQSGGSLPVVIADQIMPGMPGDVFLAELHRRSPQTLAIMLTGQASADAIGAAINNARLYRYMSKPWRESDLAVTVREAMRAWDQARELAQHRVDLEAAHEASMRFVPHEFLHLLGKDRLADVAYGDFVERELTVFFSDMRSFTTLLEGKSPAESFRFLNEYLELMAGQVREHGGFIGNIEGDAILALFASSPADAVRAGCASFAAVDRFNEARSRVGEAPVGMGVGVNTGRLILGTVGSAAHLQCDVVGDPANLAARIESLTKRYGTRMLISEHTVERLGPDHGFELRPLDRVRTKGKSEPVKLYEVLDPLSERERDSRRASAERFAEALRLYESRALSQAARVLWRICEADPRDGPAHMFAQRVGEMIESELSLGPSGVYDMKEK